MFIWMHKGNRSLVACILDEAREVVTAFSISLLYSLCVRLMLRHIVVQVGLHTVGFDGFLVNHSLNAMCNLHSLNEWKLWLP